MRYRFGEFVLDRGSRSLHRRQERIAIQPKHFELLSLLIERRPAAVPKAELFRRLWPDVVVEEANLHNLVSDLRKLLENESYGWIRTIHRYGYAFVGEAAEELSEGRASPFELRIGARSFPLRLGENVIGRDDAADVLLDAPGISRRHARVVVDSSGASLEDLGSKNGTFLGTRKVVALTPLREGDPIVIARIAAVFCRRRSRRTTMTEK
ncbi:MAG TPA: FHA domain-containing protein [Thermoanaerobaculia bacterium]|nr:FHA domain-containing protein [Thermoanaerobaculia bacterium]